VVVIYYSDSWHRLHRLPPFAWAMFFSKVRGVNAMARKKEGTI
jgi:hypothetical protein